MNPQHNIAASRWYVCLGVLGTVAFLALAGLSPQAPAQTAPAASSAAPAEGSDVQFKLTRAPTRGQMISVPVNQGVLVDFTVPIREVRVANPDIADVTVTAPKQILVNGKSFGTTQLIATVDGNLQRVFTVAVDLDLERLQAALESAVPQARIKATGMLDTVVLSGNVPDAEAAERAMQIAGIYSKQVINQMRVAGVQQVCLRVTVAEVNRSATRELGFNGWMGGENLHDIFAVNQIAGINPVNIGGAKEFSPIGGEHAVPIPFTTDASEGLPLRSSTTMSVGFPRVQMQIFIKALRENGLLKVLAEPNLVTVSGQEATFLAGGEYPVPVAQRDSVTVEFREFGVRLNFTPTVLNPDVIRLKVAPEVSEPDYSTAVVISGYTVPGLSQRRVNTVVELGPGQTFAIGGLLSEKSRGTTSKVPAFGDVPVLGALFSSVEYQSSETELVVLVTPELVEPLNPNQVTYVPGSQVTAPNDWELFALGLTEGQSHAAPNDSQPDGDKGRPAPAHRPATAARLRGPIGPAGDGEGT